MKGYELDPLSVVKFRVELNPVQTKRVQKCTQAFHTDKNTNWKRRKRPEDQEHHDSSSRT